MKVELLVSALNADSLELASKMHIASDAVMIIQCDENSEKTIDLENGLVRVFTFAERGVGKSRNHALENAKGDILVFSDEDIVYDEGYAKIIENEFIKHPEADGLFFNVRVCEERRTYYNTDYKRVRIYNAGRYPAYSIAVKKSAIEEAAKKGKEISYSTLFGGGAKYSCGEDSIFIKDCLEAGLKMFRVTAEIGEEVPRPSTWFKGYNEKYFFDRGVMYHFLYGKLALAMGFRFVFTKKNTICTEMDWKKAFALLRDGIKEGRRIEKAGE